jgi:ribosomal protein S13
MDTRTKLAQKRRSKHEKFMREMWEDINRDETRAYAALAFAKRFGYKVTSAREIINRFHFEETKRLHKLKTPRIEELEDGTVVHVYQSKLNYPI